MATTTTTSGGTVTSFSNTPQAQDDVFTTGVIGTSSASITEDLLGVVYLDVMSNDLGGNAKTLWSLDDGTSLSTATKVYAPADLLVQDTSRIEATSSDSSLNGAKIWITSDGKVGYDAATLSTAFKTQLQSLAAGASLTDSFTYAIRLGNGTLSWATAQVQFAGMNDSVTMNIGVQAGTVTEDAPTTPSTTDSLSTTGTIAFSDVDLSDTHTASFVAAGGNTTALGNFSLASVVEAANAANGTVNWTYTVNNAAAQYLAQGQTATETYVVTLNDGHGSSTTQNVIITITGTNDQVHITSGAQTGDAKEDSGDYAANGSITFTDADLIDTHSVTVTPGASGYLGSFTTDPLHDSTGTGSGSLGWHFTVDNAAVQFLGEGQTLTQTYNVAIGDGTVQTVTITITGTNDRPTLAIADTTGAMSEGNGTATLSDSGALSFADVDNIDVVTVSHTSNGNIAWSGGTLDAGVASALVAGFSVDQNSWDYSTSQNLDFLGAGETVTFSYTVVATDNSGAANAASATQTVTITITGSNDAPVLSFASGNDVGAVQEDTILSVSGQFSSSDIDHNATATWSIAGSNTGTYGSIAVDGAGKWTYTLANGTDGVASAVQSLQAGESHNEVFSVQVSDGLGGVDTQQVTVTVTGSNDAPVLSFASGNDVGTVQEDTTLSVSGQFSSSDIDHNATATWSIAGSNTGTYGSIAVDGTGQWTYTLANGTNGVASAVQSLQAGETHNEVFNVQVSDGLGGVDTQQVTVTVTGSNDAPVLSFASGNDIGAVKEDTTLSVSGQFSSADIDHNATATWSIAGSNTGTYGSIAVDSSGQWTYTLANGTNGVASAVQSLQAGETHNEVFTIQVSDGLGGVDTQQVTVTVTGSNDAPVLSFASGNDAGNVQEDTTLSVSGQFSSADIDHNATATWSIAGSNTGTYGSIAVDSSGQWTYTLANGTNGVASAVQSLQAGESHNEVFTIQVSDGLGGVDTQQVTVTVTGSNDAPVLSFASGNDAGTVKEDTTLSVSGQFSSADIDHNATATWSIAGSNTGTYGSIAVDSSGQWTYTLANGTDGVASAVQSLKAGESHNEVFSVQVSDGLGGVDTQQVTVTVTGSNDAPVLSFASGNDAGTVQEDTTLSVSGQFSSSDIDHNATATWSINGSATGTYGSIAVDSTGQWTYTLANGTNGVASAVQSLQAGETHNEVFTIQVSDGLGGVDTQQVTVTVTGSNDAPVLSFASGNDAGNVQEDTTLSVSGQFSSSDIDHAATATWSIAGSNTGTYGSIAVDSTGQWTYTLANGTNGVASAVQSLQAGESHNEVFTIQVSDGLGGVDTQQVTVTVTGSNDAPVLSFASGNDAGNVQEDSTLSVSGQFSSSDIDHAATATWSIAGSNTGTYGSIAVDGTGQWTYTLANGTDGVASAVQSLQAGESHNEVFSVQVSDGLGGVDTQQVTVTVTGSNDAPVLSFASGNDIGAVKEDTTLSVSGQFSSADIDHNATATWSINGSATGTYGSIAVDSSGQWTYTLANGTDGVASAVQSLKAGESHNEVFSVQVSDGLGGVDTQQVTVTVTGSNDAPVLSFASGNDIGAVKEDTTLSVSGQFSSADIDHNATATWSIAGSNTGTYGSIAVDSSGQWTYTLANGINGVASAVQSLQAGESHNEVFSVQVSDGLGGVDTQQVTVTVTGSNDAPELSFASGNDAGTVQEDTTLSVSGQFSSSDIDHAATATWSIAGSNTGTYGSIAVDSSGQWTYTLANGTDGVASAVQSLKAGESHNEVFSVQVSDGLGGVDTQQVTVTVTGSNDAPVLSFASGNDIGAVKEDTTLSVSGQFSSADIDHNATATWSIAGSNTGTYGSIAVDGTGQWTYTLANGTNGVASAVQSLQAGESHNEVFTIQVSDGLGGVDTQQVTVTVTGSNDAAVLSSASVTLTETNAPLTTGGSLTVSDIDSAATFVGQTNTAGSYGQFSIGTDGAWTYVANSAHNEFAAGTTYTDTFAVSSADGTATSVTVHILGTNDAAVLSADVANLTETNAAVDISTAGTLTISDVDSAATFVAQSTAGSYGQFSIGTDGAWTYVASSAHNEFAAGTTYTDTFAVSSADGTLTSVTVHILGTNDAAVLSTGIANLTETNAAVDISTAGTLTISDVDSAATFVAQTNTAGSYGQFSIGTDGAWTYVASSAHNEFAAGTTYTDTFAVSSADGTATSVTVHILGTNDAAVLSADVANLTETNAALTTNGTLTISDVDSAATFVAQTNTAGSYGQFSIGTDGAWTYVANSAHNEFAAGTTYTDTFAVSSADGTATSVTVHVLGTNDAAVLSADVANLTETNAALTTNGTLTISDVDSAATFVAQTNTAGSYGQFSIGTGGAWTYVANSAHNEFAAGTTYTDTFAVSSADGTLTSVTVHILGTNDAAVLSAGTANLTETNAAVDISTAGTLTISDVDSATTFVAQTNTAGTYGQFSIGTDGAWTYVASSAHNEFAAGTTYTDTFAVSSADGTATSVTVHILGTNDAAVLSADVANLTETNAALTTNGTLTISDVDSAATFVAQTNTAGSYGQFSIGTDGAWTYVASSAHNEFAAGTTYTDTFAVSSADGTATSVTVHILGTNDAAVLSAGIANLTETNAAVDISTAGTLTISDVDSAATFVAQTNTAGSYGQFSIGTGGAWTYVANSAHNEFAAGTTYTDTFAVSSADGTLTSVTVHIAGSNDSPTITSNGAGATASISVAENTTAITTVTATDVDLPAQTLSYSIVGGVDAAKFSIVSGTGVLSFISAPNFEAPTDTGTNNVYDVIVRASDGTLFDDQAIAVTVTGVNDNSPVITSNGAGATASVNVAENTTAVTTVAATDADLPAQTLTYSIVGGVDAAKFSIVSGTGVLSFISAPNFEAPTDSGTNNVYDVIVRASDGTLFDDQAIAVTVTGVNDNSPIITSNGGGATASVSVAENTTAVTTVVATDADLPAQTLSYSILNTAGTDFNKFSISSSGVLTFNSAPDYENPQDVGGTAGDNAYVVDVQVADGNGGVDTQTITVNVQNVVETPVDTVAPTVTSITALTASGTPLGNTGSGTITITFSEAVINFDISDFSVTAGRGTLSNFSGSGTTYTVDFTRTNNGSVKASVTNTYTDLAGNTGVAFTSSANLPAGVAGEPINLALNAPLADISGPVTVSISGVPSGWVFNAGTDNGDGTWTVHTNDPGALTVTAPSDFVGALVLDVNMSWSNIDGSTASAYVFNNVEVYAPGAPIFALSADDNLTGSSGADTFVFAQPIGNNQIYNFDATADKIDLVGFTGINGFADLSITNDANGNALVSISSGQTVTLKGVDAADLSEANFQFDVDPLTNNSGTLTIADGAIMPFGGSIHNSGTIELGSAGSATSLEVLFRGATLTGGGQVLLSDNAQNVIFGGSADTVLTNVDNRISGAGQLGAGQMVLINSGLIMASGLNSLVLDTGTHTITNSGVLESTGPGGMTVASTVENTGHLWANGGDLRLLADVTGDGSATIDGNATLTFSGAAHGSVAFHGEGAGTLVIAQAETAGSLSGILGLESDDMLTFGNLAFGANTQLSYNASASGAGGLLTVDDGVHRAEVNLLGHYSAEDFQVTDGGAAGTQVSYHGESSGTLVGTMLADTISGGDGNDIIVGREGADTLSGGAGADVFAYFNVNEGGDHILDYNYAEGDKIDLSALLKANFVAGTSQVSDFVQVVQTGTDITVKVDTDGASNGKNFVDVAVLDHTGTPGPDLVRTWFGDTDHTLTA
ncbi:VCBS domain-containing protein [Pseudomonas frederiksbergensis]|uniref:VCBS domain-containing protein n=1 Tax=Pseudomonas frederiksbergensis TaxID=104087 RepID=UPI0012FD900D|nr:VCBS domain-containing protein [Pseudomonas frederiksbergensis]